MIEVSPNLDHSTSDLFTFSRSGLSSELALVAIPVLRSLLFINRVLMFVPFLQSLVQVLPHVANDPCDLCHSEVGMLLFDVLVDVHPIEEEGAKSFLRRLRRNCSIVVERHFSSMLCICLFSINDI